MTNLPCPKTEYFASQYATGEKYLAAQDYERALSFFSFCAGMAWGGVPDGKRWKMRYREACEMRELALGLIKEMDDRRRREGWSNVCAAAYHFAKRVEDLRWSLSVYREALEEDGIDGEDRLFFREKVEELHKQLKGLSDE